MATAAGSVFGTSSGLFGSTAAGTPAFGAQSATSQPATSGFSFATPKPTGVTFGAVSQPTAPSTGFGLPSFGGKPSASVGAFSITTSQPAGLGSLGASTIATTSSSLFGSNLFGAKQSTATSTAPFQLQTSSTGGQGLSLFGNTSSLGGTQQAVSTANSVTG